jgi:hypothetical protein
MKLLMDQMESQKKFQESLLNALNNNTNQRMMSPDKKETNKYKEKNKELLTTN